MLNTKPGTYYAFKIWKLQDGGGGMRRTSRVKIQQRC